MVPPLFGVPARVHSLLFQRNGMTEGLCSDCGLHKIPLSTASPGNGMTELGCELHGNTRHTGRLLGRNLASSLCLGCELHKSPLSAPSACTGMTEAVHHSNCEPHKIPLSPRRLTSTSSVTSSHRNDRGGSVWVGCLPRNTPTGYPPPYAKARF